MAFARTAVVTAKQPSYKKMNQNTSALVSVIVPSRNRPAQLSLALASIAAQDYKHIEVIVVDDGSSPPVQPDALRKLSVSHTRLIRNDVSIGGAAARNQGIAASTGEYFSFLDDDDVLLPRKLSSLLEAILGANGKAQFAFGQILIRGPRGIGRLRNYPARLTPRENLRLFNMIHNNSTLISRNLKGQLWFFERLVKYQDLQFNAELFMRFSGVQLNHPVAEWRVDYSADQITDMSSTQSRMRAYIAYRELLQYMENTPCFNAEDLQPYYVRAVREAVRIKEWGAAVNSARRMNWRVAPLWDLCGAHQRNRNAKRIEWPT